MKRALRISSMSAALVAAAALGAPMLAGAAGGLHVPTASTDKVLHVRGNSAELTGTVNPHGLPTTYFFQFGPTTAYAFHTAAASAGSGTKGVRVGQFVRPFALGYHYRLVATNAAGTKFGRDFVFLAKGTKLGIELFPASAPTPYGHKVIVLGRVTGAGAAGRTIVLQASPWPYHEAFESVGRPAVANAAGLFAFDLGVLGISTQFRAYAVEPLPKVSKVLLQQISVRVTLKVRSSNQPGLVRLYGTVTPVDVGARVELQVKRPVRPGKSEKKEERTTRFATQAIGVVKPATKRMSRFSVIVSVKKTGWYRAFVLTRNGSVVPGGSHAIYLHTAAHGHKAGH